MAQSVPPRGPVPVILNLGAGQGSSREQVQALVRLFAENGIEARVHAAIRGDEILEIARRVLRDKPTLVVAAGGDGTVSAVASCVRGTGATLAVLPMGTLNHFARDLGIPGEIDAAVKAIAEGRAVGVDVGEVNERPFLNNASLGLYPDIVRDRTRQQRRLGRGKAWAMFWATLTALRNAPFLALSMEIDGAPVHCRSPFVFIGNNDYTMEGFSIGTRSSLRDGRLSIYTTQRRTRGGLIRLAFRALFGRLRQADDFSSVSASCVRIDAPHKRLLVATDGEVVAMETPLNFRVLPGALAVIVPARLA